MPKLTECQIYILVTSSEKVLGTYIRVYEETGRVKRIENRHFESLGSVLTHSIQLNTWYKTF